MTWDQLPPDTQSESEDGPTEPLSPGVPPGTYDDEKLPGIECPVINKRHFWSYGPVSRPATFLGKPGLTILEMPGCLNL